MNTQLNRDLCTYYPYVIKEVDNNYYLYNINTNAIFQMDDHAIEIFIEGKNPEEERFKETIDFLKNNFILVTEENNEKLAEKYSTVVEKKKMINATGMALMVSQECNLRCRYCYGKDGEYSNRGRMSFDVAKKAIDYLIQQAPSEDLTICFFGGEPLMNFNLMKEVVTYVRTTEEVKNKKFSFSMTTNATMIDDEVKKFIKDNKMYITVSIDGNKEMTDENRYFADRNGVYDIIKNNVSNAGMNMTARATIASPNIGVLESVNHLIENFDFDGVAWAEAHNLLSEDDYNCVKESTLEMTEKLELMIKKGQYKDIKRYVSYFDTLKKFHSDGIRSKGCGAGSNIIAVDIDGKVYPCHRFVGIDKYVIGNISNPLVVNEEFHMKVDLNNFPRCQSCLAKSICGGGCISENYVFTGSINEPSINSCNLKISIVDRILETYIRLTDDEKQHLFSSKS